MYVFAGLGNPGAGYAKNRHNIGYLVADAIARDHGFEKFRSRSRLSADIAEGRIGDARVALLKPTTFMNESGRALGAVLRYYKVEPAALIVFHDELDLAPGKLRVRLGGGSAGHNGMRSAIAHIGADFWRVRMGIGHPGDKDLVTDYVLSDFSKAESLWVEKLVDAASEAAPLLLHGEKNDFMTRVAFLAPPPPRPSPRPRPNEESEDEPEDGI
ncbi:MAG: aminoacyl-tRNA hydrolase [Alphaproteobacteria bacterium]|jgi:PTH1 family peptidyl-tRNA hydrolase|nr:aminoacyl-tRNA hydrolase [Alphaproteobacteria bacterium]MDP6590216.1 aminoacyl-tRNA hydrolase [Alphaproteobacteria bacterium]MDP6817868.1 aminoacyl-tRNA hydrolase [Alphaproteobacteria bacterium]